jgi:hypothetical protein
VQLKRRLLVLAVAAPALNPLTSLARTIDIRLRELVRSSEYIALGKSSSSGDSGRVLFQAIDVYKDVRRVGSKRLVFGCPFDGNSESYDLSTFEYSYVLFAIVRSGCLEPAHGISSVVAIADGVAYTHQIADQPDEQLVSLFARSIREALAAEKRTRRRPAAKASEK